MHPNFKGFNKPDFQTKFKYLSRNSFVKKLEIAFDLQVFYYSGALCEMWMKQVVTRIMTVKKVSLLVVK